MKLILIALFCLFSLSSAAAEGPTDVAARLQMKYRSVKSMKVDFHQLYEANGIQQEESGVLYILKPGRMRWEYIAPEKKLFLVDGKNSYFYVPADHQVSTRKLTKEDIRYTAFGFLLDQSSIDRDFQIDMVPAEGLIPKNHKVMRLTPKQPMENIEYLLLGLQPETLEVSTILVQEPTGARNNFSFTHMVENPPLQENLFEFKVPKGVEVISLEGNP
jgi:outer membrane lipoprotein carrier protein